MVRLIFFIFHHFSSFMTNHTVSKERVRSPEEDRETIVSPTVAPTFEPPEPPTVKLEDQLSARQTVRCHFHTGRSKK